MALPAPPAIVEAVCRLIPANVLACTKPAFAASDISFIAFIWSGRPWKSWLNVLANFLFCSKSFANLRIFSGVLNIASR